ncbi:serine protease [Candidatus Eisenbacteria bacterium]|uniref:Serine protease n=1 Tax=Eiseniibacteriota bacterium TaxID=2212470 RepID=A0ABV6YLU7_UNCEI
MRPSGALLLALLLLLLPVAISAVSPEGLVARITADLQHQHVSNGTGFVWKAPDQILTAYHVVHGSTAIRVLLDGKSYDQVRVLATAPERDLALLLIENREVSGDAQYFPGEPLPAAPYDVLNPIVVPGFVWGWSHCDRMVGQLTDGDLVSSRRIRDPRGRDLFAGEIDLLKVHVGVYGGMSGAPVIQDDVVIGVLSGSLHEGTAITWAIPIAYTRELVTVDRRPADIVWPAGMPLMKQDRPSVPTGTTTCRPV